jgi:hypothetical protein
MTVKAKQKLIERELTEAYWQVLAERLELGSFSVQDCLDDFKKLYPALFEKYIHALADEGINLGFEKLTRDPRLWLFQQRKKNNPQMSAKTFLSDAGITGTSDKGFSEFMDSRK